jgi:hypothetical protein
MKELVKSELMEMNGGVFGWDDFLIGIAVGTFLAIINDWDNFERGFNGEPYKSK